MAGALLVAQRFAPTRAALAQLVEHRIRNAGVTGSSPVGGTSPSSRQIQQVLSLVR